MDKMTKNKSINKNKKKTQANITTGRAYITVTFNNVIITITDNVGNTICWGSSGTAGFKGARKSTPYAATTAVEQAAKKAATKGLKSVEVYVKGPGPGRDGAIRALKAAGLDVLMIADVTPIPHNGVRAKKRRRV